MPRYGKIHQVADFVARSLAKEKAPFAHEAIEFLKAMSAVQGNNALITLGVQAGDGLRVVYAGHFLSLIIPQQKHVRVLAGSKTEMGKDLRRLLTKLAKAEQAVYVDAEDFDWWRVLPGNLSTMAEFFASLPKPSDSDTDLDIRHPRFFPGPVREAALADFERGGNWCPGVNRPRHKVDLSIERIAFDHILPFARGGASSENNIQVLCEACNTKKRATALGNAAR